MSSGSSTMRRQEVSREGGTPRRVSGFPHGNRRGSSAADQASRSDSMILAGDTGGTKTVLALCEGKNVIRERTFAAVEHGSLEEIVEIFLEGARPRAACFGVAGPIEGHTVKI